MRIEWFLIKMLFYKGGFGKSLKKYNKEQILDFKEKAIKEENFELASVLAYYIEFKKYDLEKSFNTEINI